MEIYFKIKEGKANYSKMLWSQISDEGLDLTKKMLEKCSSSRITIKEALIHPWFTLEWIKENNLSIVQKNLIHHCNTKMFDVGRIKPKSKRQISAINLSKLNEPLSTHPEDCQNHSSLRPIDTEYELNQGLRNHLIQRNKLPFYHYKNFYEEDRDESNLKEQDIDERGELALNNMTMSLKRSSVASKWRGSKNYLANLLRSSKNMTITKRTYSGNKFGLNFGGLMHLREDKINTIYITNEVNGSRTKVGRYKKYPNLVY